MARANSQKRSRNRRAPPSERPVLAYDLGGTKVVAGIVSPGGKILTERRELARIPEGRDVVLRQLAELGRALLAEYPRARSVGVASAGPLHPERGTLLDPTNFSRGQSGEWDSVPLARTLERALKRPVVLENDAAAAALAEHWQGAARGCDNAMILTLGTGLGTGVIANGELVRSGRQLHPEAGHVILRAGDATGPCGCGNLGCAEAYLSGRNFAQRFARQQKLSAVPDGAGIAARARAGDAHARAAFDEYAELLAVAVHNYVVLYAPERVILTGSFAEASDLFFPRARARLAELLARRRKGIDLLPELLLSTLRNRAGLLGGAYIALRRTGASGRSRVRA